MLGYLTLLNRFNASNSARSWEVGQAQSFSPYAKSPDCQEC